MVDLVARSRIQSVQSWSDGLHDHRGGGIAAVMVLVSKSFWFYYIKNMFPSKYNFCIKKYIFLWLFSFCIQSIEFNPNQLPAAVGFSTFIIGSQLPFFTIIKISLLSSSLQSQLKRGETSSSARNRTRFVIYNLLPTVPSNMLIRSGHSLMFHSPHPQANTKWATSTSQS